MDWSEFVLPQSYQFIMYFTLISQNYITFVVMQREPKFKIIVHFIEEQIQNGKFGLGDQIPSVNALRIRFGLSRSSIFLAMEDLKSRGIIEAEPAVGYYVRSTSIEVQKKILLLFNELNAFKEKIYQSLVEELGSTASVDIMFHNYDRRVFEALLREAEGRYTSYVLMPGKFTGLSTLLDHLQEQGKVYLLDHFNDDIAGRYPGVRQDFYMDTYDALLKNLNSIRKYDTLVLVQHEAKEPEERYKGILQFAEEFGFGSIFLPSIQNSDLRRGILYITPNDRELACIIKKAESQNLEIGSDIGIISYNDTPLKEILCGGITTLSTDFTQMGKTMASLIQEKSKSENIPVIRNPWVFCQRRSL